MGGKQLGFSDDELTTAKKQIKREKILSEMEMVVPWQALIDLIEVPTMRRFAGIELISDRILDETTILSFRHLLEKHVLGEQIVATVKAQLGYRGITMSQGTIVDATLIAAPNSAFTRAKPECAGGTRTKRGSGIRRCSRPIRATSATSASSRRPAKR